MCKPAICYAHDKLRHLAVQASAALYDRNPLLFDFLLKRVTRRPARGGQRKSFLESNSFQLAHRGGKDDNAAGDNPETTRNQAA